MVDPRCASRRPSASLKSQPTPRPALLPVAGRWRRPPGTGDPVHRPGSASGGSPPPYPRTLLRALTRPPSPRRRDHGNPSKIQLALTTRATPRPLHADTPSADTLHRRLCHYVLPPDGGTSESGARARLRGASLSLRGQRGFSQQIKDKFRLCKEAGHWFKCRVGDITTSKARPPLTLRIP